jgi:hypothetical protein
MQTIISGRCPSDCRFAICSFECQIDRAASDRPSTVTESTRNGCHLAPGELDFAVLEFDHQPTFDNEKHSHQPLNLVKATPHRKSFSLANCRTYVIWAGTKMLDDCDEYGTATSIVAAVK